MEFDVTRFVTLPRTEYQKLCEKSEKLDIISKLCSTMKDYEVATLIRKILGVEESRE